MSGFYYFSSKIYSCLLQCILASVSFCSPSLSNYMPSFSPWSTTLPFLFITGTGLQWTTTKYYKTRYNKTGQNPHIEPGQCNPIKGRIPRTGKSVRDILALAFLNSIKISSWKLKHIFRGSGIDPSRLISYHVNLCRPIRSLISWFNVLCSPGILHCRGLWVYTAGDSLCSAHWSTRWVILDAKSYLGKVLWVTHYAIQLLLFVISLVNLSFLPKEQLWVYCLYVHLMKILHLLGTHIAGNYQEDDFCLIHIILMNRNKTRIFYITSNAIKFSVKKTSFYTYH